jgi:hypothetical protein
MANLPASQWFFEVLGKRSGPYSTEQILELYRSGQLGLGVKLIPQSRDQQEMTLEELIGLSQFQPPPKPEISKDDAPHAVSPSGDPTMSLFDALQAAKDRKAQASGTSSNSNFVPQSGNYGVQSSESSASSSGFPFPELSPGMWIALASVLGVTLGGWGIYSFIMKRSSNGDAQVASGSATSPKEPVAAQSSPAQQSGRAPASPATTTTAPQAAPAAARPVPISPSSLTSTLPRITRPIVQPPAESRDSRERERDRDQDRAGREDDSRREEEPVDHDIPQRDPAGAPDDPGAQPAPSDPSDAQPAESGEERRSDPDSSRID